MSEKTRIQPPGLFESKPLGFTQVLTSPPGRLVFVSGQTAWSRDHEIVGGADLAKQAEAAFANLAHALRAAGARPADVAMLRLFIVDYQPAQAAVLTKMMAGFFGDALPASTWLGVAALAVPGFLIEIEAVAVVAP